LPGDLRECNYKLVGCRHPYWMECPGQYSQEGWSERDCQVEGRKAVLTRLGDHRRWTGRPSTTLKFGYEVECVRAEQQQQHAEASLARRSVTWLQVNLRALGTGACMLGLGEGETARAASKRRRGVWAGNPRQGRLVRSAIAYVVGEEECTYCQTHEESMILREFNQPLG
jgi:hypothetical protein